MIETPQMRSYDELKEENFALRVYADALRNELDRIATKAAGELIKAHHDPVGGATAGATVTTYSFTLRPQRVEHQTTHAVMDHIEDQSVLRDLVAEKIAHHFTIGILRQLP